MCLVCKEKDCNGTVCLKNGCYKCGQTGDAGHSSKLCRAKCGGYLEGLPVCHGCLIWKDDILDHDECKNFDCKIGKRLLRLYQHLFRDEDKYGSNGTPKRSGQICSNYVQTASLSSSNITPAAQTLCWSRCWPPNFTARHHAPRTSPRAAQQSTTALRATLHHHGRTTTTDQDGPRCRFTPRTDQLINCCILFCRCAGRHTPFWICHGMQEHADNQECDPYVST